MVDFKDFAGSNSIRRGIVCRGLGGVPGARRSGWRCPGESVASYSAEGKQDGVRLYGGSACEL